MFPISRLSLTGIASLFAASIAIFMLFCRSIMFLRFPGTDVFNLYWGVATPPISYCETLLKASDGFLLKFAVWSVERRDWLMPFTPIFWNWIAWRRLGLEPRLLYKFSLEFRLSEAWMPFYLELCPYANLLRDSFGERQPWFVLEMISWLSFIASFKACFAFTNSISSLCIWSSIVSCC